MKPILFSLVLAIAASASPPALPVAAETGKTALRVECFAGPELQIPVSFVADPESSAAWFADVYLDGGELAAPLARAISFTRGPAGPSPYLASGWFRLALPEVLPKAPPDKPIILRLILSSGGNRQALGSIEVRVSPRDFLRQAFAARLGDPEQPFDILVFGPAPGPRELLAGWQIPFRDAGPNPPRSAPAATLVLGETVDLDRLPAPTPGASLFVVSTDPRLAADTEIRVLGGALVTVVRPATTAWNSDPRLHRLLAAHLSHTRTKFVSPPPHQAPSP